MAQPVTGVPAFADVVERVKPAVVAVKVKVQNAADRDEGDGQQFSMPDLPPGHPMERFFRQFRDQMQPWASAVSAASVRNVLASSASLSAPASSSRPTAMW